MATSYSDLIVLLARQRNGSDSLRSVLETHESIFCFNNVFDLANKDSAESFVRETNFFTFVERYARGDVARILPDRHELLFQDFFEYLRCFTDKQYKLISTAHNTAHFFTPPSVTSIASSSFLEFIVRHETKVLQVTRDNYLRVLLSTSNSQNSDVSDGNHRETARRLDVGALMQHLELYELEDRLIAEQLAGYPYLFTSDYARVFPRKASVSRSWLAELAAWLEVPNRFRARPGSAKQSSLPSSKTIENFDEVETLLRGTRFEYCLEDGPARHPDATADLVPALAHVARDVSVSRRKAPPRRRVRRRS